jgi:phosphate acetyltransferase
MAVEYARRREHKGVTMDAARDVVVDVSYFGTLMVALGMADGMVSGAVHTTAQTIRPSLELIRTVEGVSIVSSVFFMCLADRVLVYGDCAVNVHPTAEQLADIAISSAAPPRSSASSRGWRCSPTRPAESGSGREVERCAGDGAGAGAGAGAVRGGADPVRRRRRRQRRAHEAARQRGGRPGDGVRLPRPQHRQQHLQGGAAQRGRVAVGPVLQGLRKPVNDLSRGATVQDIVNTVAITAIQAQNRVAP